MLRLRKRVKGAAAFGAHRGPAYEQARELYIGLEQFEMAEQVLATARSQLENKASHDELTVLINAYLGYSLCKLGNKKGAELLAHSQPHFDLAGTKYQKRMVRFFKECNLP